MDIEIEKGIPIPVKRANAKNNFVAILRSMEVGDSFLFDRTEIKPSSFYVSAGRLGFKITVREIDEKQSRVWRTE
jgi:hypothetical protein